MKHIIDANMLDEAIAALCSAIEAMEKRSTDLNRRLSEAKAQRRDQIQQEVLRLLPEITKRTPALLKAEVPTFVTKGVLQTLAQNRKLFGLFATPPYRSALTSLQAKLARFIESEPTQALHAINKTIMELEADRTKLDLRLADTTATMKIMMDASVSGVELPPAAKLQVSQIVARNRDINSGGKTSKASAGGRRFYPETGGTHTTHTSHVDSSDDLWFYMLTDIPTSFRTLMLDAFHDHGHSHRHDDSCSHDSSSRSSSRMTDNAANAGAALYTLNVSDNRAAIPDSGVATMAAAIATDDSLGAFS